MASYVKTGILTSTAVVALAIAASSLHAQPAPTTEQQATARCQALGKAVQGVRLEQASYQSAGELPAHCEIIGVMNERVGVDGQSYAIRYHLRLPLAWNQKFFFQGGGGSNGDLGDALGRQGATTALAMGFAVVSQDAGHDNAKNTQPGKNGASAFGFDPIARRDYGRTSLKATADAATTMIQAYYGQKPRYSYFVGCSKGGQEGMVFAQDYPQFFDGIIASAPGFSLPRAAVAEAWDTQTFGALTVRDGQSFNGMELYKAFTQADLALVRGAVLKACDGLDGLEDGLVTNYRTCTTALVLPQLSAVTCQADKTDACITPAQVKALVRSHDGPRDSTGRALYSDWAWSAGIATEDWRIWKIGSSDGRVPPLNIILGGVSLAGIFTTPPTAIGSDPVSAGNYLWAFDFDRDAAAIYATDATFTTSPWSDISARSPDLDGFRAHQGKLIVMHGTSDPVFSVNDTTAWYDEADARAQGKASDFVRVFPVPDMGHCAGGTSTDQFDAFTALVDWVEHGKSPEQILATAGPSTPWPNRKRPLCPYPKVARYIGGDTEDAASFECRT